MKTTIELTSDDIKNILARHLVNSGYESVTIDDITLIDDVATVDVIEKPYEPIKLPLCSKVNKELGSYPRCMNLVNRMYCNKIGGCC